MAVEFVRSSQRMGGNGECRVPSAVVVINVYRECVRVWEEYILGHRFSWYLHLFWSFFWVEIFGKVQWYFTSKARQLGFPFDIFFFFRGSQLERGFIKSGALFEKSKEFKIFKSQIEKIKNKKVDKEIPMLHYSQNPVCLCLLVLLPFPFSQVDSFTSWKSPLDKQKGEKC